MKIAISTNSGDPDGEFSARFGRCACFLITDSDGTDWQEVENPAMNAQGGAGAQVVQLLANLGIQRVISGRYGPNAFEAIKAAGVTPYLATSGTARGLVNDCLAGRLETAPGPSGKGFHSEQGRGRGQGGRGQGGQW